MQSEILQLPLGNSSFQILRERSWQWAFATSFPGHYAHKTSRVPHFSRVMLFNGRDSVMKGGLSLSEELIAFWVFQLTLFGLYYFKIHKWHSIFILVKRYYTFWLKSESWSQLNFNEFETSLYIRTLYWSIMLYLLTVFLIHVITICVSPLTTKISLVILLTVGPKIHVMLVWKIWN